jgi:hypothetical protein
VRISGRGAAGYVDALEALAHLVEGRRSS